MAQNALGLRTSFFNVRYSIITKYKQTVYLHHQFSYRTPADEIIIYFITTGKSEMFVNDQYVKFYVVAYLSFRLLVWVKLNSVRVCGASCVGFMPGKATK